VTATDVSIKMHNKKGNIYLGIIALLVIGFIYFIFFSITHDISSVNSYMEKQTRINFMYQNYFREYLKLVEKRSVLKPYIVEVNNDTTTNKYKHNGKSIPRFVLETFFENDSLISPYYELVQEALNDYKRIELRISALNGITQRIDSDDDLAAFWDGHADLDLLFTKTVFPHK
jgi:hypothetical protein